MAFTIVARKIQRNLSDGKQRPSEATANLEATRAAWRCCGWGANLYGGLATIQERHLPGFVDVSIMPIGEN